MNKTELQEKLALLQDELELLVNDKTEKQEEIDNYELDSDNYTDEFDALLDDTYGMFMHNYYASEILKEIDPTAYSEGLLDFVDTLDKEEDGEYQDLVDELNEIEDSISEKEGEIEEIEEQIEELEEME